MPYTFGGATTDDIAFTIGRSLGLTASASLVMGWWYPTTLTATRGLWSAGNIFGAEIDTTTSELRLRTDNTTDKQWTTTGAALATDKWTFLAFQHHGSNTGSVSFWRVWMGTIDTAPVEITVTVAVAGSGNHVGSSAFVIGNKGTGSLAFQGDASDVIVFGTTYAAGVTHPLHVSSYTSALTADEAGQVRDRWVLPYWSGDMSRVFDIRSRVSASISCMDYFSLQPGFSVYSTADQNPGGLTSLPPTINGATISQRGCPRPYSMPVGNPTPPPPARAVM